MTEETPVTVLDKYATYAHPDFHGVALTALRYAQTDPDVEHTLTCTDEDCLHDEEWCWEVVEVEPEDDLDWVYVVMVGDDTEHLVEFASLEVLPPDGYCRGCGQIGCGHEVYA